MSVSIGKPSRSIKYPFLFIGNFSGLRLAENSFRLLHSGHLVSNIAFFATYKTGLYFWVEHVSVWTVAVDVFGVVKNQAILFAFSYS